MLDDRAVIARYFHRFGFGPKPGQYAAAVKVGPDAALKNIFNTNATSKIADPVFEVLGPMPPVGAISRGAWNIKMRDQRNQLTMWWLDRMADVDNPFVERMTWFWHGHWATSLSKVEYANAMYVQNQIFRKNALGNFQTHARAMIMDGALQYWLDNNSNNVKTPNENLARELMELFTLGVNRYTEVDIKQAAKALTGYSLDRESGVVTFNPPKHDTSNQTILGKTQNFDALSLVDYLVSRDDCATFISERLWYRFVSDENPLSGSAIQSSFVTRDISSAMNTLAKHPAMRDEANAMVKAPLEWFIGACRALNVLPSQLGKQENILGYLDKLAQKPFYPPNVGGWPAGEIWLTAANAQYRIELAQMIVTAGDLTPITEVGLTNRVKKLADLLGVGAWTDRTKTALVASQTDPAKLITTALCAPEYMVSI